MSEDVPLHKAIMENDDELVQMLLNYVDINQKNEWSHTPISLAIDTGNIKIIQLLLDNGAWTDVLEENFYPIQLAIKTGSLEIFKLLLKYKADLHVNTECFCHCIHLAATYGKLDILEYLLELGVSVDRIDGYQYTPLHKAIFAVKRNAVAFLLKHKADVNMKDKRGNTPLHFSILLGLTTISHILICHGARADVKNLGRLTPFDFAIIHGRLEIVKYLYEAGVKCEFSGECTYSSLHRSAQYGHFEVIAYFLNKGADINFRTKNGYTMLHSAARNNHPRLVLHLITSGADLNYTTIKKNYSALDFAALSGNPSSINILIQHCATFEVKANGECRLMDLISKKFSHDLSEAQKQKFWAATEVIIKFIALRNRHASVFFPRKIPFLEELSQFWHFCKRELEIMDSRYVANSTISHYQLFQALCFDKQLGKYLKNEALSLIYNDLRAYIKIPPMYDNISRLIRTGVARGKTRNTMLNCAHSIISEKITNKLPPEIIMEINEHLSTEDLMNLAKLDMRCALQMEANKNNK